MNDRTRKILEGLGYASWFGFLFISLTLLTFPWSRVRDNLTISAADGGYSLTMDKLGPAWVGGSAKNLSIGPLGKGNQPSTPWITFEKVKAKTGLFGVLRTARAVTSVDEKAQASETMQAVVNALKSAEVYADIYGGDFTLDVGKAGDEAAQIDMNLRAVNLTPFELASAKFSMNPRGNLRGKSNVTWHWEDPKKSAGNIDLTIDDLVVSGLKAGAFGLPEMAFTRSEAHLKIARGKAEFDKTIFEADEVQAVVEGYITLNQSLMRSRLSMKLRFKLRDDLDGLAKVALGSNPRHKDEDGWYHYQLNGTLSRPNLREGRAAAGSRGGKGKAERPKRKNNRRPRNLDKDDDDERVSRRSNKPTNEPVRRKKLHEMEDPEEIEAERQRLREERETRREERKKRREELLARRRERQERLRDERGETGQKQVFDDGDFVRSNGDEEGGEEGGEEEILEEPEEEIFEEEPEEEIFEEEGDFEGEGEGEGEGDFIPEDEGDFIPEDEGDYEE